MKAMVLTGHGGPEMFRFGDVDDPKPAADEIVVDVHAASVNAADYKVRLGGSGYNVRFPHILGRDFSGVVASRGVGSPISRSATPCSASWMPGSKAHMRRNSPSRPLSWRASPLASLTCKPPRWR